MWVVARVIGMAMNLGVSITENGHRARKDGLASLEAEDPPRQGPLTKEGEALGSRSIV